MPNPQTLLLVIYRACGHTLEIPPKPARDAKEEIERAANGETCPRCRAMERTENA